MPSTTGVLLLVTGVCIAAAQNISKCPTTPTNVTTTNGSMYQICNNTDYQGPSSNILGDVNSAAACLQICDATTNCRKAVYDHVNSVCHIKGNPTDIAWAVSNQYDTIQYVGKKVDGSTTTTQTTTVATTTAVKTTTTALTTTTKTSSATPTSLTACPSGATTFTTDDGILFELCPNTTYTGTTSKTITVNMLSDWDCLQACHLTPNCTRAVFNTPNFVCTIKASDSVWTTSTTLNTIRFVSKTAQTIPTYKGLGAWSPLVIMPVIPVAVYAVPQQPVSNRVLMFSSWGSNDFSGPTGITQFADYNYATGAVSARTITNTQHDMFCPGISSLQDGRIVITGGENAEVTSYYDPTTDTFIKGPDMKLPRGYQSSATTSSGKVFTIGGSFTGGIGGKVGEILDPVTNTWTLLPGADVKPMLTTYDAEGEWRTDNHAWLFGWKDQSVFQAGPSKTQHWYGTTGQGSVSLAGTRDSTNDAMCGVNVMYDAVAGKIFSTGGSQSYTDSLALTRAYITTINKPFQAASVQRVADMLNPRGFANADVLPDGTILISGGQKRSLVFTDIDSILEPELFDPVRKTFKKLAPATIPRNYHSVSVLLSDGTVFTGGGGLCPTAYNETDAWCNRAVDHYNAQIFSPPYLFNADGSKATRPVITTLTTSTSNTGYDVRVGGTLTVTMNDATGATFSLIRMGSATHSVNTDQRRVPLTTVVATKNVYKITLPSDAGILIPGYYYLFALSKTGVPSVARTVQMRL